ncbi:MAG: isoleucine--tRNA ligase [Oscillospiraceae bacterium]
MKIGGIQMLYKAVDTNLNFRDRERVTEKFWRDNEIFEKSNEGRDKSRPYVFYDGPPTANGKPHIGHVLTRVIKDMIPRYHAMKGSYVPRKAGWDTHGLPVEIEVEKSLGINGKEQIEKYGLAPFIEKCKESVWTYKGMWEEFSQTVGFWADMENPYVTYHNNYIESVWWSLKKVWERGLLYKGFKTVPYCPRCGTPLSSHEVAQGYKDVKERSAVAKFKAKGEDAYFLAWTTTPWTLPSNLALCVHPQKRYCRVKADDGTIYYMAESLVGKVLGEDVQVLETMEGRSLEFREYEPLFDFVHPKEKCYYVVCDNYVSMDEGTGIVHIAPAFGEEDSRIGRLYKLPFVQLVDEKGAMTDETPWAGMFCKDADKEVFKNLKERGLLFSAPKFEHSYPFCWRCDTPLLYYARESWYIQMTAVRDDLVKNNATINWIPPSIGKGRFGDWIENVQDWAISRNRYWGTPLPIWECVCGHRHAIGSIAELKEMSDNCPDDIELHRPYIDAVTLKCPECGGEMHRVPEVIDCWYDSGAMPFAQHHYPFENKELFESQFPADFISEAVDQTRGWFYSLLAISTLIFNEAPFKNCIVLGHVQDENGQKMSKSKGNAVDPFDALETYGADAIRWYFYNNSAPWLPNRFQGKTVLEGQRKFMSTLWNSYAFFVLYANIDNFNATEYDLAKCELTTIDLWLLSKLNTLITEVDTDLAEYKITESSRALLDFVDGLSNWYVRRCRERFWAKGMESDKISAYMTLYTALLTLSKLTAPLVPFMSEEIYRNLACSIDKSAPMSVHLCDYPVANEAFVDKKLEADMDEVLAVVTLGRAARNAANIKTRQPLATLFVAGSRALDETFLNIIEDELNVKELEFGKDASRFVSYVFKPQLKVVGAKYGKRVGEIRTALSALEGAAAKAELDSSGSITVALPDGEISMTLDELLVETTQVAGYETLSDGRITVALDIELTDALVEEGFVNETISKLQSMRKEAGFNVTDKVRVFQSGSDRLEKIMRANEERIAKVVLAVGFGYGSIEGFSQEWDVNGEMTTFGVKVDND